MQPAVLKGTNEGYELVLDQSASFDEILVSLTTLLNQLKADPGIKETATVSFDVLTGNRLLSSDQKKQIEALVADDDKLRIHKIVADVITTDDALRLREQENVHPLSRVIRNGQTVTMTGDVLFLGTIHEGGKLETTGNVYNMGNVQGILHVGFPEDETKIVLGDLSTAQQVRIGEQFDIIDHEETKTTPETVTYVNDLHVLSYGKLIDLKDINPKLYHSMGGL